jgi:hypothetical protein
MQRMLPCTLFSFPYLRGNSGLYVRTSLSRSLHHDGQAGLSPAARSTLSSKNAGFEVLRFPNIETLRPEPVKVADLQPGL